MSTREFDHVSFEAKLNPNGLVFFHDSVTERTSTIYGEGDYYEFSVHHYIQRLKENPAYQVMDFPFADGLTLVRQDVAFPRDRQQPWFLYAEDAPGAAKAG